MKKLSVLVIPFILAGCQSTGEEYRASSYQVASLNQKQEAKTINIIAVTPAQVQVDNKDAQKATTVAVGLLGAVAGAAIGGNSNNEYVGGAIGGVAGGAAGSLVDDKVMVEGVTLTYSEDDQIFSSTQVGFACEFKPGVALVISTAKNETRVQPNAECPKTEG